MQYTLCLNLSSPLSRPYRRLSCGSSSQSKMAIKMFRYFCTKWAKIGNCMRKSIKHINSGFETDRNHRNINASDVILINQEQGNNQSPQNKKQSD